MIELFLSPILVAGSLRSSVVDQPELDSKNLIVKREEDQCNTSPIPQLSSSYAADIIICSNNRFLMQKRKSIILSVYGILLIVMLYAASVVAVEVETMR